MQDSGIASITTYAADLEVLSGFVIRYKWRPIYAADDREHAEVFYSKSMTPEEARLVRCKEVLHLLDGHEHTSRTLELVGKLISEICLPFSMPVSKISQHDRMGILPALCILLPRDALDILRPLKLAPEAVAKLAGIPEEWAGICLSEGWKHVVENLDNGK